MDRHEALRILTSQGVETAEDNRHPTEILAKLVALGKIQIEGALTVDAIEPQPQSE